MIERRPQSRRKFRSGFTLIELLCVVAVIIVLAAMAIPGYQRAIQATQQSKCVQQLSKLATGIQMYAADNNGCIPRGWEAWYRHDWQNDIAPYFVQENPDHGAAGSIWQCPSLTKKDIDAVPASASYAVNKNLLLPDGCDSNTQQKRWNLIVISSRTVLLGDSVLLNTDRLSPVTSGGGMGTVAFRHPSKNPADSSAISKGTLKPRGEGRANIAFCDGHVETLDPMGVADGGQNNIIWIP